MACTKEEIEKKRLAALQKRQNKLVGQCLTPNKSNAVFSSSPHGSPKSTCGPIKTTLQSSTQAFHPYAKPGISGISQSNSSNNVPVGKVISGTVYLISEERFEVNPSEFCAPLIEIFKSLPSKSYVATTKLWNFSINDYHELMKKVAPLAPHIVLGGLPSYVLKVLQENTMDPNTIDLSPVEATLRNKLMPFQEEGVRFAIARRGRCMIADDMGLGKTFQALAIASYYRHNWPLLIVTTSSMREIWQSKIHELLPSIPMMNIVTLTSGKDAQMVADRQTEIVIVSYKITSMHTDLLKSKKFGVVIIDESHYLKSHKAQCTLALGGITRRSARAVLLSGTPALSRPAELYTQLSLIDPKLFGSYTEFGKRYCAGKQTNFGWDMTGQSNLNELQIILQKRFLIRRTKEQVLTTLEGKIRETVLLDASLLQFSAEQRRGLSALAAAAGAGGVERHAALLSFFSESAKVKIPAVCKYIREVVKDSSTGKFLVFAHHKNMIEAISSTLDEEGVHYICIVGSTPTGSRAELVDRFQHSATCRGAVLSLTAAGAGLTLTAADLVLFAELHWNPGVLTQAEARAHRLGRRRAVRVRYLLAANTADDHVWPMLRRKLHVLNDVGLSKDTFEDSAVSHQESKNSMTQYLSPISKNKNDYIPGTNIRKGTLKSDMKSNESQACSEKTDNNLNSVKSCTSNSVQSKMLPSNKDILMDGKPVDGTMNDSCAIEESFLDDDEDDALLANLDL